MRNRQDPGQIQQKAHPCGYTIRFHKVAEHFDENIEKFLRFIQKMIQHVLTADCQECEEELIRGYQVASGCNSVDLGHQVSLHQKIFTGHPELELTHALTILAIDYPELALEISHIRQCFGCALMISNRRNGEE